VLFLTREQCPFEGDDRGETVRAGVSHALRNSQTHRSEPTRVWTPIERGDEVYVAALEMGMEIPDDINFRTRLQICWTRTVSSALARFRRMLPRVVSEHASLCGYAFSDARSAAGFLVLRGEWSLRDYERMNQAIRLVPILRDYLGAPEVTGPVRTGRPIEEAIRGVVAHVENALPEPMQPLHPKTVKSLGATWPLTLRRAAVRVRDVELIRVLERLHRRDTHLRPFRTSEMMQIARIMLIGSMETDHVVDAIMAHRDVKGRVQEVKDLRDAYNWIHGRLRTVLFTGPGIAEDELWVRAVGAAYRILFPESRRHGGLAEVVADWHTRQARLDAGFRNLFQTMVAAHLQDRAVDVSEILFPHFLAGETTIDGVTMRPLVEEDDIVREGEEMDHCVGSYVGGAQAGRSLLISQVSDAGRSTVEVRLEADDRGEPALVVQQNRAPRNEEPPAAHVRAISKLLALFPEGVRRDLAERIRRASAMAENDLERNYALLTPDELARLKEHALADLRYFMPRALRRPTVPEWVSHLERMEDEDDARRAAEAMGAEPLVALAS
jgi:hypothetical protein